ncbi:CPK33 [Symbiodinium sp. CCMP2592]|nr:CPK33 [Symbiodinium sp. CCMP2592]
MAPGPKKYVTVAKGKANPHEFDGYEGVVQETSHINSPIEEIYFTGNMLSKYEAVTESLKDVINTDGDNEETWEKFDTHFTRFLNMSWATNWDGTKYDIVFYGSMEALLAKHRAESLRAPRASGADALGTMGAFDCWLHGIHVSPKVSWPQGWQGDFRACSDSFLLESAERRYRLERILQRAAAGQTLTSKSKSGRRWYGDFGGLKKPSGKSPLCLSKEGILWEVDGMSSLLIPLLLADVMFAPVHSKLAPPFSPAPDATHIILIAPRATGRAKSVVWLLCTSACDCSLDHFIISLSRRGAVRWDSRQCLHLPAHILGQGSQGTVLGGMSLLPLYEEHRTLIPSKADVLNMSKVHNFGRVAVKIWDKLDSAMVRREVCFLQQSAGHPNISALLGVYAEARKFSVRWLLAMEHCTEGDLFNMIKAKCLSLRLILDIQAGLSSALTHLHCLHIVHRDVKAENVVMQKDRAVLIDFGVAAYRNDKEAMCQSVGSPGYAAPEMIAPIMRCYDELVDVFALGVLSYFMMFRALPFWGATPAETLQMTQGWEVEIPGLKDERWSAIASLVLRMMSKEAKDRPSAMRCFKEFTDLESLVTMGGKSRAVRIAHAALVHYGYVDAPEDCSLEILCGKDARSISEEASPSARAAAPKASLLGGLGRISNPSRRRSRSLPVRVRQRVSKALQSMLCSSEASVSRAPQEPESAHCFSGGVGLLPSGDAEADPPQATGAQKAQAKYTLPGRVVSNSSVAEAAMNQGGCTAVVECSCRSTVIAADTQNDQESKQEHTRVVLDFPLSARSANVPLHEDMGDMLKEDPPSLLVAPPQDQDFESDHPPAEGASLHHPGTHQDAQFSQFHHSTAPGQCAELLSGVRNSDLSVYQRHLSESSDESQDVLPGEADAFEFAPVVSGDLE